MSDSTTILFASTPLSTSEVAKFAEEHNLARRFARPWTSTMLLTEWGHEQQALAFTAHAESGIGVLTVQGDALTNAVRARFETRTAAELLSAARNDDDEVEAIRSVFALGSILDSGAVDGHEDALETLSRRLLDDRKLVRWAASRVLAIRVSERVVRAFDEAAAAHPELQAEAEFVRQQFEAANDGTLYDGYTESWHELVRRAREGLANEQYRRTEKATEMLLEQAPYHKEGLLLRGLAYEALGEPALALALVGASFEEQQLTEPENDREEQLLAETAEALRRLHTSVGEVEADPRFDSEIARWNAMFSESYHRAAVAGMAAALREHVPTREALFSFISGRYHGDVALLERTVELAPDSPAAVACLAELLPDERANERLELYERALEQTDVVPSPVAAMIEEFAADPDPVTRASILEGVARAYYDASDWDNAATWSDRLVEEDPRSTTGWQMRANARTFGLRHEDAVVAYEDAIRELGSLLDDPDSYYFGDDPLPGMHFNHSCVLAKLGRRDEALDALRRAVREDEVWAERAASDDYWEQFWNDDTFAAIASGDDDLVTAEERERPFVEALVTRALGQSYKGDVDAALDSADRAAVLAATANFHDLRVRALAITGRTLAFHEDPLLGLETMQQAFDEATAHAADIGDELVADTTHDYAVVLQAAERLDDAAKMYEQALTAREDAYGPEHPILAKSYGDMARLKFVTEDVAGGAQLIDQGLALLADYFASGPHEDDDRHGDALVDRASLCLKRANVALHQDDERAIEFLSHTVEALEALMALRYTAWNVYDQTAQLLDDVIAHPSSQDEANTAHALRERLDDLELSPDPAVRAEQVFWRGLRNFANRMLDAGVSGHELAQTFGRALRGEELPPALRQTPEVGGLARSFAERANRSTTFIATAALALNMAEADGDIDTALGHLEGICVAEVEAANIQ